jgi:hypothetical protein
MVNDSVPGDEGEAVITSTDPRYVIDHTVTRDDLTGDSTIRIIDRTDGSVRTVNLSDIGRAEYADPKSPTYGTPQAAGPGVTVDYPNLQPVPEGAARSPLSSMYRNRDSALDVAGGELDRLRDDAQQYGSLAKSIRPPPGAAKDPLGFAIRTTESAAARELSALGPGGQIAQGWGPDSGAREFGAELFGAAHDGQLAPWIGYHLIDLGEAAGALDGLLGFSHAFEPPPELQFEPTEFQHGEPGSINPDRWKGVTGNYLNIFASGKTYDGKGWATRPGKSGAKVALSNKDQHVATDWTPQPNPRAAFKAESRGLQSRGGPESLENYNEIDSPGTRYRIQDGELSGPIEGSTYTWVDPSQPAPPLTPPPFTPRAVPVLFWPRNRAKGGDG